MLHSGENELLIRFHSPVEYIEHYKPNKGKETHIVPAGSMFGWDWGIQLPDMGIWRDISLEARTAPRLMGAEILQKHENGAAHLTVKVQTDTAETADNDRIAVQLTAPNGSVLEQKEAARQGEETCFCFDVQHPQLWWPNGYGEQPLYQIEICLLRNGNREESHTYSVGLRTLTVLHEPDKWGKSFTVCVNGLKIFARGANYIPEDAIYPFITLERQKALVQDACKENMNCLRIWGGGYYPSNAFYDLCDRAGILVWQDLMFADDTFDLTSELEENIVAETRDNVLRLRHHACLLLWCGNNEMESAWAHWGNFQKEPPALRADYIKMFEYILPRTVQNCDHQTFYWASSPSSGGCIDRPDEETDGDVHYWDVWHVRKPFTEPKGRNIFSKVMESHQKNGSANGTILEYISQNFRYPGTLRGLTYLSQVLQGMAIKYGVEHWRRQRGQCMGSLFWQLNDNWPVVSWSAVDYFGRYKMLHYMARRFYAPTACSLLREGTRVGAYIQNETAQRGNYTAKLRLRALSGELLDEVTCTGSAAPYSAACIGEKDYKELIHGREEEVIAEIEFSGNGLENTIETEPFVPYKYLELQKAQIQKEVQQMEDGWRITLHTDCFAPFVWLDLVDGDGEFSDNGFPLNGQEDKTVLLKNESFHLPEGVTPEQALTVTCLQDTYL